MMITLCDVIADGKPCMDDSHIVLFALGGTFAGRRYQPGQHIGVCLRHGAHILDARRTMTAKGPARWLAPYLHQLPLPKLPAHDTATITPRPKQHTPPKNPRPRKAGNR